MSDHHRETPSLEKFAPINFDKASKACYFGLDVLPARNVEEPIDGRQVVVAAVLYIDTRLSRTTGFGRKPDVRAGIQLIEMLLLNAKESVRRLGGEHNAEQGARAIRLFHASKVVTECESARRVQVCNFVYPVVVGDPWRHDFAVFRRIGVDHKA